MQKDPILNNLDRRAFLGHCGLAAAACAIFPNTLQARDENPTPGGNPPEKPYGSGYFGEWITDEFGLPAFQYTCDQTKDPKAVSQTDPIFRAPTDQTHQVGNDRLVAAVSNYGYVQVRQDEGAPKFLNDYAPERSQFGAGFGYLTDGKEVLGTFYPGSDASFERSFGMGYLRKQVRGAQYSIDQVIFAPFGDDPVLISQVTLTNHGQSPADLRWIEYWGCQVYQFSYRACMQASILSGAPSMSTPGRAVELRRKLGDRFTHRFERLNNGLGLLETKSFLGRTAEDEQLWQAVQDSAAARAHGDFASLADSVGNARLDDLNPPPTFLASLDGQAEGFATNGKTFFGEGGVHRPTGLERGLDGDLSTGGPESALLLERHIHLNPGQSRTLHFIYGYIPQGFSVRALIHKYQTDTETLWTRSSRNWKQSGMRLSTPADPWVEREISWHYYYLRSNLTYDGFFYEHILSQSGEYQYLTGFQGAARDPLQHALPLVFSDPQILKKVVRYTLKEMRPNGSIPYALAGHGMQLPDSQDDSSDQPLWLLWAASEYVLATRDVHFLDEEIPFNMVNGPGDEKAPVRKLLALAFRHMVDGVGSGPHHLIRMLMDDWDDGLVYSTIPNQWLEAYLREGESVFNSAMGGYVYDHYARLLEYAREDADLRAEVSKQADGCRQAVQAQWAGRWFRRAWLGTHFGWLGTENLWADVQPWTVISNAASAEQARTLIQSMDELLRTPSPTGALDFCRGSQSAQTRGEKEWSPYANLGNVAPALNGMLIWSLALVDGRLAWDEWKKSSLARHAEVYPDIWSGIWSATDSYHGPTNKFPGCNSPSAAVLGTGTSDCSVQDYPVMNMHAHAWPLYSAAKLLGVEFSPKGVSFKPVLPLPTYRFTSTLLGFEKSSRGYEGWYAPSAAAGTWSVTLQLSREEAEALTGLEVNGAEISLPRAVDGSIEIKGESFPGKPLRWSLSK
jgi:hypothetical protein